MQSRFTGNLLSCSGSQDNAQYPEKNVMTRLKSHLHSVNESYFQHMRHALGFTVAMFGGALCCLVHAFLPFLFEKRGSAIVERLHDRMVRNRGRLTPGADTHSQLRGHEGAHQLR